MSSQHRPEFFDQPNDFLVFPDLEQGAILFAHLKIAWLLSRGCLIDEDILNSVEENASHLARPRINALARRWNLDFAEQSGAGTANSLELEKRRLAYQALLLSEVLAGYGDAQASAIRARHTALQEAEVFYFGAELTGELH